MALDIGSLEENNFGYPAGLLTCSADETVLDTFKEAGSVVWRRELSPDIATYTDALLKDPRLPHLHGLRFNATYSSWTGLDLELYEKEKTVDLVRWGHGDKRIPIKEFFPALAGVDSGALAKDIENLALEAQRLFSREWLIVTFWTLTMPENHKPHKDSLHALGSNYSDSCTEIQLPDGQYASLRRGDRSIFDLDLVHREGTSQTPFQPRLWAGAYTI